MLNIPSVNMKTWLAGKKHPLCHFMNLEWLVFPNSVHFWYNLNVLRGHENIPTKCTFPFKTCLVFRVIPVVYFSKVPIYYPDVKVLSTYESERVFVSEIWCWQNLCLILWDMRVIKNSIYDKQHTVQRLTGESWHRMRIVGLFEGKMKALALLAS